MIRSSKSSACDSTQPPLIEPVRLGDRTLASAPCAFWAAVSGSISSFFRLETAAASERAL